MTDPVHHIDPLVYRVASQIKTRGKPILVANLIGALFSTFYFTYLDPPEFNLQFNSTLVLALLVTLVLVATGSYFGDRWSKDFVNYIDILVHNHQEADRVFLPRVQKKVLVAPIFYSALTMLNWTVAALVMGGHLFLSPPPDLAPYQAFYQAGRICLGVLFSGVLTSAIVFFLNDNWFRKYRHVFFPQGGLSRVPGVPRITVHHRILFSYLMIGVLPMMMTGVVVYHKTTTALSGQPAALSLSTLMAIGLVLSVLILSSIVLSRLVAASIADPIKDMETVMNQIRQGDLSVTARPANNDELGALAESLNHMIQGLRERDRLRQSLDLAMEVQQNLLPKSAPRVDGLDVAGRSYYCEETGGDYFDFLPGTSPSDSGTLGLVVGDVSDHGIQSALLMTTARAFLRQRFHRAGLLCHIVSDVNRQLCLDVEESGRFMTLFLARADASDRTLTWVSAGHDPALVYHPATDSFDTLTGKGPPLGVIADFEYQEFHQTMAPGDIIAVGTDGIWETRNESGEMFGKDRLKEIIRSQAATGAEAIRKEVHRQVNVFRRSQVQEDDITLVILKFL